MIARICAGLVFISFVVLNIGIKASACEACKPHIPVVGEPPKGFLGGADKSGGLTTWMEMGAVKLADGSALPLRVAFSTTENRFSPIFGQGWWCPLLESTAVAADERRYDITLLGGRSVMLRAGKDKKKFVSGNEEWVGVPAEGDVFRVTGPKDSSFVYVRGRLKTAVLGQSKLTWIYSGKVVTEIREEGGKSPVTIVGGKPGAMPVALALSDRRCELEFQDMPLVQIANGQSLIAGFKPSLKRAFSVGYDSTWAVRLNPAGALEGVMQSPGFPDTRYSWAPDSGRLLTENEWTYSVPASATNLHRVVERVNAQGQKEFFESDSKTGVTKYRQGNGTEEVFSYMMARGPTHQLIRKREQLKDGQVIKTWRWNYDEKGRLLRKIAGDVVEEWTWDEAGNLKRILEQKGEQLILDQGFDEAGRLIFKKQGNNAWKYAYTSEGKITQRYLNEKLVGTMIDGGDPLKRIVLFPEVNKAAAGAQAAVKAYLPNLGKAAGALDTERARALVERANLHLK